MKEGRKVGRGEGRKEGRGEGRKEGRVNGIEGKMDEIVGRKGGRKECQ